MNDSITIKQVVEILKQDGILTEVSCPDEMLDHPFDYLSYSSSDVKENTFFICKGAAFKEEYLLDAVKKESRGISCRKMLYQDSSLYPDQRYPQSNELGRNRFLQGSI